MAQSSIMANKESGKNIVFDNQTENVHSLSQNNKRGNGTEKQGNKRRRKRRKIGEKGQDFWAAGCAFTPDFPFFLQPCVYARYLEGEKGILDLSGRLFDILCLGSWNFYTNITWIMK